MQDMEMKKKVLEEMMDLMDEKEGENLKLKSPKFMAAKVEVSKPESLGSMIKEKPSDENPELELEGSESDEKEEMSPEMIQKLLEMYEDMK